MVWGPWPPRADITLAPDSRRCLNQQDRLLGLPKDPSIPVNPGRVWWSPCLLPARRSSGPY
ncbi:Uncharacterized protein FKW44_003223 [Caligus rogercresseyi]|uniref:Uncharacterized protein n=1 Tax=Caligus rogercresseyi TaxID=217165 RepID=A0A7T8KL99_CALRO|nr:Uncharacterized protein FKW44_003223 [Caligus rogercresseyi]